MVSGCFRFDRFLLDCPGRQLRQGDASVELNSRYLDALILLVREQGALVSKERFMEVVWRGVPVTDEALTQCIKTLRRQLGDNAASPRFIETVPKHGYRFIAPVEPAGDDARPLSSASGGTRVWRDLFLLGGAGTFGAGAAGFAGGLFYGFAAQPLESGMGAVSVLLVLMCVTILVALLGGAGVAFGIAMAGRPSPWSIAGGAAGGLVVGAFGKLLGLDAFALLLGHSPGDITGAAEGFALGGAVGLGHWLAGRHANSLRHGLIAAGLVGSVTGILIPLLGGRLLGGSLDVLARNFPGSRLQIGGLFGESGFGPVSQIATGGLEGALFGVCIVGAMLLARRTS